MDGSSQKRKTPLSGDSGVFQKRERERKGDLPKGAAHGFRAFRILRIPPEFEQEISRLKTFCDLFLNIDPGEDQGHLEQVSIHQDPQLAALDLHEALGDVQAKAAALGVPGNIAPDEPLH